MGINKNMSNWEVAYNNIQMFIQDCEVDLDIKEASFEYDSDERAYHFKLISEFGTTHDIWMPDMPTNQLRYNRNDGGMLQSRQFRVDGQLWYWWFALIKYEDIFEYFKDKISRKQYQINELTDKFNKIKLILQK